MYLASALQRLEINDRWDIASNLVTHAVDSSDANIPFLLWYAIEPIVSTDPAKAMALSSQSKIRKIKRYIARRLTIENKLQPIVEEINNNPTDRNLLLLGMRDGLEGYPEVTTPDNWSLTYKKLRESKGKEAQLALDISILFGDKLAAETLVNFWRYVPTSSTGSSSILVNTLDGKKPCISPLSIYLLLSSPIGSFF